MKVLMAIVAVVVLAVFLRRSLIQKTNRKSIQGFLSAPLPILQISQTRGQQALLKYSLTEQEKKIASEMDTAVAKLPEVKDTEQDIKNSYRVIIPIGQKYGLSKNQSIAFWVRSTFRLFEAKEFSP